MPDELTFFQYWVMTVSGTSLCVSLVALLISWVNAKRTNASVVRVVDVQGYVHASRPDFANLSHRLAVTLKNLGLPLHDAKISLAMVAKDGSGTLRIDLSRCAVDTKEPVTSRAELAKGMVALFEVRSDKFPPKFRQSIRNYLESDRYLELFDCGFLVQTFSVGNWVDRIGSKWNRVAHWVNWRFNRKVTSNQGHEMLKLGAILPKMRNWQAAVDYFLREFKDDSRGVEGHETGHGINPADPAAD